MDPVTHTLVGAGLATTRLGRLTRLAPAALIVGANLPDVDILAYAWGEDAAIGFRRGWTHGVLALVVLPLLLTAGLILCDRWTRRRAPGRPPARALPLLLVSAAAVLTHPVLDWLNNYGMRWWMPFDGRWSYGDALFIVDPWLWLVLGAPWLLTRRPTLPLLSGWAVPWMLIAAVVWSRAPQYLGSVLACAAVLLLALLRRPPEARRHHLIVELGLLLAGIYIVAMVVVQEVTARRVRGELEARGRGPVARVMAGPVPLIPWTRDIVAEVPSGYVHGEWRWWPNPRLILDPDPLTRAKDSAAWPRVRDNPEIQGYLRWSRFPWIATDESEDRARTFLLDARYARGAEDAALAIEVP